jgi:type VI secretion system protein ImpH
MKAALHQELCSEPYRFEFFQAVRLLERIYAERAPLGRHNVPAREAVRLRTPATLDFPPSQICGLVPENADEDTPPHLTVAFMGLVGPLGVLPHAYTELLIERRRVHKDLTLHEFFDLFNHRLISFFYRAWEKYRFPVSYERRQERDLFTSCLFSLVGLGTEGLRGRTPVANAGLLHYSGLVAQRPHSASALQAVLADYFGITAQVQQFFGQWLKLDDASVSRLGRQNNQLGVTTVAGARVWDVQSKFRVRLGPLSLAQLRAFTPEGPAFAATTALLRTFAGPEMDFDLQLVLAAPEVPACQLTTARADGPRLGWTSWLKTKPFAKDDEQVVILASERQERG